MLGIGRGHNAEVLNKLSGIGTEQGYYVIDDCKKFAQQGSNELEVQNQLFIKIDGELHAIPVTG